VTPSAAVATATSPLWFATRATGLIALVLLTGNLFGLVEGRGACQLPDGVTRLAASALRVFADDVRVHERGPCIAARGRPVFAVPSGPARAAGPAAVAKARAWGARA
jgi:hypothetical protein